MTPVFPKTTTLMLLRRGEELLLAMKKRGFGAGKWNGPGSKVQPGETVEDAAVRECAEETGISPRTFEHRGVIEFVFEGKEDWNNRCHIFLCHDWMGEERETDEMRPAWFPIHALPYEDMWEDDRHWVPELLAGETMRYRFFFDAAGKLLRHEKLPE